MVHRPSWSVKSFTVTALAATALASVLTACSNDKVTIPISPLNAFKQTNLVADTDGQSAALVDKDLVNAWGIGVGPTGVLWSANNHSGTSTLYDPTGAKLPTTVTIPGSAASGPGAPTGVILNTTADFVIPHVGVSLFVFAGEDGTVTAWAPALGTTAQVVANRSANNAVYKGLAVASNDGANFLYLTDFKGGHIDVFDRTFTFVKSFTDSTVPAGYAPFGIANLSGQLFVTFAKQQGPDNEDDAPGAGNGFVDVFNPDGTMSRRFASNGQLNSPWGIAVAPPSFGAFGGDILIGNFGDGRIGAYDPTTGKLVDMMRDSTTKPIVISGLWGLAFGAGANSTKLYFAAGPSGETHGLLGTLTAPVPTSP